MLKVQKQNKENQIEIIMFMKHQWLRNKNILIITSNLLQNLLLNKISSLWNWPVTSAILYCLLFSGTFKTIASVNRKIANLEYHCHRICLLFWHLVMVPGAHIRGRDEEGEISSILSWKLTKRALILGKHTLIVSIYWSNISFEMKF